MVVITKPVGTYVVITKLIGTYGGHNKASRYLSVKEKMLQ
jgi:hypothetical protein